MNLEKLGYEQRSSPKAKALAQTSDSLLKIAREDIPARVTLEDDAMSRIYAMLVAFEYVNILSFAYFSEQEPSTGGALDYLLELETRRRDTPGVAFIILADRKFRKRVFKLCTEFPERHPTFSAGLRVALGEYRDIWQEARMEVFQFPVPAPPSTTSNAKRERDESRPALKLSGAPGTGKKARQTAAKNARIKELENQVKSFSRPQSSSSGSKGGKGSGKDRPRRVPDQEYLAYSRLKADSKYCKFYNMSCGCNRDVCPSLHLCPLCAEEHRWVDRHYSQ